MYDDIKEMFMNDNIRQTGWREIANVQLIILNLVKFSKNEDSGRGDGGDKYVVGNCSWRNPLL